MNLLQSSHKFLALRKKKVVYVFRLYYAVILVVWIYGYILLTRDIGAASDLISVGKKLGDLALILYIITLIPGIFTRLKIFSTFTATLKLFRRQFGVSTFLTAVVHQSFVFTFLLIATNTFSFKLFTAHEVLGLIALLLLFPMWLSSNDFVERKMGRWWKIMHRITYVILMLIFFHVATSNLILSMFIIPVIVLEIISWIFFLRKKSAPIETVPAV